MKLRELAAGCAVLLGIDDGFLREGGVMTEDEQLVYEQLKSAINSVYNFISKDYCRPLYTETVTTDNKSGVLINELTKSFMQFHSAKNEKGAEDDLILYLPPVKPHTLVPVIELFLK